MAELSPGTYPAVVVATSLGEMDNEKGTPYLMITFDVNADADEAAPSGRISYMGWLTEASSSFTMRALTDLGWDVKSKGYNTIFDDLSPDVPEDTPLKGAACSVVLQLDDYNDPPMLRVRFINRAGGGGVRKALSEEAKRRLAGALEAWDVREDGPAVVVKDEDVPF